MRKEIRMILSLVWQIEGSYEITAYEVRNDPGEREREREREIDGLVYNQALAKPLRGYMGCKGEKTYFL